MTAARRANADRQREYRRRQNGDRAVLRIEVDIFGVTDALIEAGHLSEQQSGSRAAVEAALAVVVEHWKYSVTRNASNRVP